jgi:hypothetical protein
MIVEKTGLLIMLVVGIFLTGCPTADDIQGDTSGGKTITFALEKIDKKSFSLTINGADWSETSINNSIKLLDFKELKCTTKPISGSNVIFIGQSAGPKSFDLEVDGKMIIGTSASIVINLDGTLSLLPAEKINSYFNSFNSDNPVIQTNNNTYMVADGKGSITF